MINEIELQVVPTPIPRARQIMVDQATNQKYEYDEDTNSCSWLASITINAKNKPGDGYITIGGTKKEIFS